MCYKGKIEWIICAKKEYGKYDKYIDRENRKSSSYSLTSYTKIWCERTYLIGYRIYLQIKETSNEMFNLVVVETEVKSYGTTAFTWNASFSANNSISDSLIRAYMTRCSYIYSLATLATQIKSQEHNAAVWLANELPFVFHQ